MKNYILNIFSLIFFLSYNLSSQNYQWAKGMGGSGMDIAWSNVVDGTGNVYAVGSFSGTVDFDPGPSVYNLISLGSNAFILKLDPNGNFIWAKSIDGIGSTGHSIALDATGNVYSTGNFGNVCDFDPGPTVYTLQAIGGADSFISKLDPNGNFIWAKSFGGFSGTDGGNAITIDGLGNVLTTGSFYSNGDFDPGPATYTLGCNGNSDTFILKLDANGNFIWAKSIGDASYDDAWSITSDVANNVYLNGSYGGTVDFDPGTGISNVTSNGGVDAFILKLDINGNFVFAKTLGGLGTDEGYSICLDQIGNIYTSGYFCVTADFDPNSGVSNLTSFGNPDAYISKLDNNGNYIWAKKLGGTLYDYGRCIKTDASGNVFTIGDYEGSGDFDPNAGVFSLASGGCSDAFISKLDMNGNFIWAKSFGGSGCEHGLGIFPFSNSLYACGFFEVTSDFNPPSSATLTSNGSLDAFVAKYDANSVGVEEKYIESVSVYPNPVLNTLYLSTKQSEFENAEIEIINTLGQTVLKLPYKNEIDISQLSNGYYILKVTNPVNQTFHSKFIKE